MTVEHNPSMNTEALCAGKKGVPHSPLGNLRAEFGITALWSPSELTLLEQATPLPKLLPYLQR